MTDSRSREKNSPAWRPDPAAPETLLSRQDMARAEAAAIQSGITGAALMEAAGRAVAETCQRRWPDGPVLLLCGPGNNGGDGFVAARHLCQAGRQVSVALWGDPARLRGDAARMAALWSGPLLPCTPDIIGDARLVVDALFGSGLSRPLPPPLAAVAAALQQVSLPLVAVDMPSGVDGDSGQIHGAAFAATATVTFCRRKPGHLLYPGRGLSGVVIVADIGIPESALAPIGPQQAENTPSLWQGFLPRPAPDWNKYRRGAALITGGGMMTGAARLAARAAQRAGAGYVALAAPETAAMEYRLALPSVVVRPFRSLAAYRKILADARLDAALIGPGLGLEKAGCARVLENLARRWPLVLDADALSLFAGDPELLLRNLHPACVLTPHEGEFARLFPDITGHAKPDRARAAARRAGCSLLLKGPDTVIAEPGGFALINGNAPPHLATAGSGDVLAGTLAGLLAGGMPPFAAAAAAVWLQGEAGRIAGPGLIAEDLEQGVRQALTALALSPKLAWTSGAGQVADPAEKALASAAGSRAYDRQS